MATYIILEENRCRNLVNNGVIFHHFELFSIFSKPLTNIENRDVLLAKEICTQTNFPFSNRDTLNEDLKKICFVEVSNLKGNPRHGQLVNKNIIHISDVVRIYTVDESYANYLTNDIYKNYKNIKYSERFKSLLREIIEFQDIKTRVVSFFNSIYLMYSLDLDTNHLGYFNNYYETNFTEIIEANHRKTTSNNPLDKLLKFIDNKGPYFDKRKHGSKFIEYIFKTRTYLLSHFESTIDIDVINEICNNSELLETRFKTYTEFVNVLNDIRVKEIFNKENEKYNLSIEIILSFFYFESMKHHEINEILISENYRPKNANEIIGLYLALTKSGYFYFHETFAKMARLRIIETDRIEYYSPFDLDRDGNVNTIDVEILNTQASKKQLLNKLVQAKLERKKDVGYKIKSRTNVMHNNVKVNDRFRNSKNKLIDIKIINESNVIEDKKQMFKVIGIEQELITMEVQLDSLNQDYHLPSTQSIKTPPKTNKVIQVEWNIDSISTESEEFRAEVKEISATKIKFSAPILELNNEKKIKNPQIETLTFYEYSGIKYKKGETGAFILVGKNKIESLVKKKTTNQESLDFNNDFSEIKENLIASFNKIPIKSSTKEDLENSLNEISEEFDCTISEVIKYFNEYKKIN